MTAQDGFRPSLSDAGTGTGRELPGMAGGDGTGTRRDGKEPRRFDVMERFSMSSVSAKKRFRMSGGLFRAPFVIVACVACALVLLVVLLGVLALFTLTSIC